MTLRAKPFECSPNFMKTVLRLELLEDPLKTLAFLLVCTGSDDLQHLAYRLRLMFVVRKQVRMAPSIEEAKIQTSPSPRAEHYTHWTVDLRQQVQHWMSSIRIQSVRQSRLVEH